jgi:triosephosphate isomerase
LPRGARRNKQPQLYGITLLLRRYSVCRSSDARGTICFMQKKLIVGNWKMNPRTLREARTCFSTIKKEARAAKNVEVSIAVPYVYLSELSKTAGGGLSISAQDVAATKEGPYTGEISAPMLAGFKTKYCIVGHSERRALGETNAQVNQKIKMLLSAKITPIVCVGEIERDSGMWYLSAVKTQVEESFAGIPKNAIAKIVIAYEPVWAISSTQDRRDATPADSSEMVIYIRKILADMFGGASANAVRILYGGSVDEKNALGFVTEGNADGLLPGKASLSPQKFTKILKTVQLGHS